MRVVIAGASGFLGQRLVASYVADGHDVRRLVRRTPTSGVEHQWDPYAASVPPDLVSLVGEADLVVNLAGSPTAGNPHSRRWAAQLRESRVATTRTLAEALATADHDGAPPAYLAGSGISYYGDRGAEQLTESADSRGDALLTSVVRDWEAAADPAREAGVRVCHLRTAPVLDRTSPPLKQMLLPFRLGLGTVIGSGRQYFPVISARDWVGAVRHLESSGVHGPVNLCCPQTPTNAEFTHALADLVGRRARLKVPAVVVDKGAGRMAPELLGSVRATPRALLDDGYDFADADVDAVLRAALT